MTGREPNPNSNQGGARRETDLADVVLASAFSPRSQAALRSTRAILRSQVACGAINGVIAAIGTIIVTSRPEIQLQAHFFGVALGNGELVAFWFYVFCQKTEKQIFQKNSNRTKK